MQSFLLIVTRCVVRINELMICNVLSSWNRRQLPAQGICKRALKCKQYTFGNLSCYVWRTNGTLKILVYFVVFLELLIRLLNSSQAMAKYRKRSTLYPCTYVCVCVDTHTTLFLLIPPLPISLSPLLLGIIFDSISPASRARCFQVFCSLLHISKF